MKSTATLVSSPPARPGARPSRSIIRSEDDGNTFTVIAKAFPTTCSCPTPCGAVVILVLSRVDPNDPQVVYLGIDGDPEPGKMGGGIFKSLDGGATWNSSRPSPEVAGCLTASPWTPPIPTASSGCVRQRRRVWRSNDGGESWEQVFRNEVFIWNVVVATDGTIYCSGEQLWRSKDQGKTWTAITSFPEKPRAMVGIEVHPTNPNIIWVSRTNWGNLRLGSIHKTTDGGDTWTDITGNIPYVGLTPCASIRKPTSFGPLGRHVQDQAIAKRLTKNLSTPGRASSDVRAFCFLPTLYEEAENSHALFHADLKAIALYPNNPAPHIVQTKRCKSRACNGYSLLMKSGGAN